MWNMFTPAVQLVWGLVSALLLSSTVNAAPGANTNSLVNRSPVGTGSFNVLSMNVAGLPEILQDNGELGDKTTNTMYIGLAMANIGYDVIHVQEDFNYHATLYQYDNHTFRTATSGGVPFGSGLNTLSNYPWIDDARVKWNQCSQASENDCLTPKGYTFMRIHFGEGIYVDFYNLHADAGTEDGDEQARASNVQQVVDAINTISIGNPVLVFGDTNTRYTRTADNIRIMNTQAGLTDAWVQIIRGGVAPTAGSSDIVCASPIPADNSCETVDKIFFRGSKSINLTATAWNYETTKFLSPNGTLLTDHNPITASFRWSPSSSLQQSDILGGPHGDWYNDLASLPVTPRAASLTLRGAARLDAASITLTNGVTFSHGGTGGDAVTLKLNPGEYFRSLKWCQGKTSTTRIFWAQFTTNQGRTLNAGTSTSDCLDYSAPDGWGIVGFYGQDGDEMDQFGVIAAPF